MDSKDLQKKISVVFRDSFGYTPLNERLQDLQREFFELMKWTDIKNLKEESGDLLASLIELHTENDWDIEETIAATLDKIEKRKLQYKTLGRKTKVAIYGGAFDPITTGHIQVAKFLLNTSKEFDEVWLMPAYKHMYNKEMVAPEHRLKMCELAVQVDKRIRIFPFEIENKLQGETYYFVKKLKEETLNEQYHFSIVIGLDNANTFDHWVNYELLERLIRFVVMPRKGYKPIENARYFKEPHIYLQEDPNAIEVSSTEIRETIKGIEHVGFYSNSAFYVEEAQQKLLTKISPEVYKYILENKLYSNA